MKTKTLFTIACIFLMFTSQVFSSIPAEYNQENSPETQFANGKVLTVKIHCQSIADNMLGDSETRRTSIYLPPGYDQNGNTNYPVIYMLSDFNGTNENWFQTFGSNNFPEILNKLIKSGTIKPVIMVFPDAKNKFGGNWYCNSDVAGNWENFVVNDIVNYIDQNFRTLPFAACRGIAGKGMGGFGALKVATKHPDIFSCVYSLNALVDLETIITHKYIWNNSIKTALEATRYPTDDEFANQLLSMSVAFAPNPNKSTVIGDLPITETGEILPSELDKWLQHDPLHLIQGNLDNLKKLKAITVDCSTSNVGIMLNSNYSEALKSNGINHSFIHFAGTESSDLLKRICNVMLPMFSENLAHSLLEFNEKPCYTFNDILKVKMITDGNVYIESLNNEAQKLSSMPEKESISDINANTVIEIPLSNLDKGVYSIYGVSSSGFTGKSHLFGVNSGTPAVKICVTDSHTGKIIKTCGVNINDKDCFITDDKGEVCFTKEGKISICTDKENYGNITKSVMIYTDTTITLSLVKDSYLQVVERHYGNPVFEAMVTQNNQATLTDGGGYTTVQNIQDGILNCRIFKPGYFTEMVNTELIPGHTALIVLTRKTAKVEFVLIGDKGPLNGITIKFGELVGISDQIGRAKFSDIETRKEYQYSVMNGSFKVVQSSLYLQADTVLPVILWPENDNFDSEMKLSVNENAEKSNNVITDAKEDFEREILIYPNPATNAVTIQTNSIIGFTVELRSATGALLQKLETEGTLHRINLSNLSNGVYFVTVKSDNFYRTERIMKL